VRLGESPATTRFGDLHDVLAQMVAAVEEQLGAPLAELSREQKQAAVRILDQRGAFLLRKAVESVGEMMGVSRITIYNYLNAIHNDDD
jgi:predicted transcriptional regulator YheO